METAPYFIVIRHIMERRNRDKLANIKGKFVLSYNDHPFIRELYQGFTIEEVERSNSMGIAIGGEKKYKELMIINF